MAISAVLKQTPLSLICITNVCYGPFDWHLSPGQKNAFTEVFEIEMKECKLYLDLGDYKESEWRPTQES